VADQHVLLNTLTSSHNFNFTNIVLPSSIGHPPHSSASPVELRLRVGPRALSGKKKEVRVKGVLKFVRPSVMA
jgi:hypothetical protein